MSTPLPFPVFDGFTAVASLSLSTDGTIPSHLWDQARAHDAAQPRSRSVARLGKVTLKPEAAIRLMVEVILKEAARKGYVLREDFTNHGLKPHDIDRHYGEALRRAALRQPGLINATEEVAA